MHATLERKDYTDKQVTGVFRLFDTEGNELFSAFSLELPWRNNERRKSCIPTGKYRADFRSSPKYPQSYHIKELDADQVNGRDWILIHQGNYYTDILGCILLGSRLHDINGDGYKDVIRSRHTMRRLIDIVGEGSFTLEIIGAQPPYNEVKRINAREEFITGVFATVIANGLNIRREPGLEAELAGEPLLLNDQVEVLEESGYWVKVKTSNGLLAFVHSHYIRKNELLHEGEEEGEGAVGV